MGRGLPRVGDVGSVVLGVFGGVFDERRRGCECLGAELIVYGLATVGVDCFDVFEGLFVLVGFGDASELGGCDVVELADVDWCEVGVEEVGEEAVGHEGLGGCGWGSLGKTLLVTAGM